MAASQNISLRIDFDAREAINGLERWNSLIAGTRQNMLGAARPLQGFHSAVSDFAVVAPGVDRLSRSFGSLKSIIASFSIGGLLKESVMLSASYQATAAGIEVLADSAEKGKALLGDLEKFARTSPFNFNGLADSSKRLLALGFSAEKVLPTIKAVGAAAQALNLGSDGVSRITLALGQIKTAGKVEGDELRQLAEAGINANKLLADGFGTSEAAMKKAVKEGIVPADDAIRALVNGMDRRFTPLLKRMGDSFQVTFGNLGDDLQKLGKEVGDVINPSLQKGIESVRPAIISLAESVRDAGPYVAELGRAFVGLGVTLAAYRIPSAIVAITASLNGLRLAAVANPWGLLAAGAAAAAFAISTSYDEIEKRQERLTNKLKRDDLFDKIFARGFGRSDQAERLRAYGIDADVVQAAFNPAGFGGDRFPGMKQDDTLGIRIKRNGEPDEPLGKFITSGKLANEAAKRLAQSREQVSDLIASLQKKALDPLAELLLTTGNKLADVVRTTGQKLDASQLFQINGGVTAVPTPFGAFPIYRAGAFERAVRALAVKPEASPSVIGGLPGPNSLFLDQLNAQNSAALDAGIAPFGGDYFASQTRKRDALQAELDFQERKIELLTGPGGELAAVQQITQHRLAGLERMKQLGADAFQLDMERQRIIQDAELRTLQLQRDRFNDIKSQAGQVFDSLTRDARNFGSVLLNILKTALLTPIRDAASTVIATILTGGGGQRPAAVAGGGFGGLLGGLGSIFTGGRGILSGLGGFGSASAPGGTGTFTGAPIGSLAGLGPIGVIGGGFGPLLGSGTSAGGRSGLAGLLGGFGGFGGALGTGGLGALLGGLTTKNRALGSILTIGGGAGLGAAAAIALGAGGAFGAGLIGGGAGLGLAADGIRRGGLIGIGEAAAGGALFGNMILPGVGALAGAVIGAGAATVRTLIGKLFKGATEKAHELIRQRYAVDIQDGGILQQIVAMAKNYGGNLSWAIDQPDIRQIIELYGLMTSGSRGSNPVKTMQSYSFVQNGASIAQAIGNSASQQLNLSVATQSQTAPIIVNVTVPGAKEFFENETVQVIASNGNAVQQASLDATKRNYGRREQAGRLFAPNLMLSGSPT